MKSSKVKAVLQEENIEFVEKGADLLVRCFNPDHDDRNPSMRVDHATGVFHCWSCGHKGNVFTEFNRDIPHFDIAQYRILQKIANLRALSSHLEIPKDAQIFSETHRGIPAHLFREASAFTSNHFRELQDRIIFPIFGVDGTILNFIGRGTHSNAPPKYLYFPRKEVYVYPQKVGNKRILLVEGLFDRLNLLKYGIRNAHVAFGTKTITRHTVMSILAPLLMQGVTQIDLLFDGDKAGRDGMRDTSEIIEKYCNIPVDCIYLPDGMDPGSMTAEDVRKYLTEYLI